MNKNLSWIDNEWQWVFQMRNTEEYSWFTTARPFLGINVYYGEWGKSCKSGLQGYYKARLQSKHRIYIKMLVMKICSKMNRGY